MSSNRSSAASESSRGPTLTAVPKEDPRFLELWREFLASCSTGGLAYRTPTVLLGWLEEELAADRLPLYLWAEDSSRRPSAFLAVRPWANYGREILHLYVAEAAQDATILGRVVGTALRDAAQPPVVAISDWIVGFTQEEQTSALAGRGFRHIRRERLCRPLGDPIPALPALPNGIQLRSMRRDDAPAAMLVNARSYSGHIDLIFGPTGDIERDRGPHWEALFADPEKGLQMDASTIAVSHDGAVGKCLVVVDASGPVIADLAVVPAWRSRGIAAAMIGRAITVLRGARSGDEVSLFATVSNPTGAMAVYRRLGFRAPPAPSAYLPGVWLSEQLRVERGFRVAEDGERAGERPP